MLWLKRYSTQKMACRMDLAGRGVDYRFVIVDLDITLQRKLDHMGFTVFAGCLCPEGPGAQSLVEEGSDRMKVLQLDVTKDEDVSLAKDFVQANLPEKGNLNTSKCLIYSIHISRMKSLLFCILL